VQSTKGTFNWSVDRTRECRAARVVHLIGV